MKSYSILIAEDNPDWQDIISRAIKSALKEFTDVKVFIVGTYDRANDALDQHWDLLVSDLGFGPPPESSKLMGKHLIEKAIDMEIPAIVISGTPGTPQVARDMLIECRAFDFFPKENFRSKDFAVKVRSALRLHPSNTYRQSVDTYDVLLCSYPEDKDKVRKIADLLRNRDLIPWVAEDQTKLNPGVPWQKIVRDSMGNINAIAMFVGKSGVSPWHDVELRTIINYFVLGSYPTVPVLLESAITEPDLSLDFMKKDWIDLRNITPYSIDCLVASLQGSGLPLSSIPRNQIRNSVKNIKKIRIFLASSSELIDDRNAIDLYCRQENDTLLKKGIYLEIIRWENFLDAMSETRLQVEYNLAIKNCDIFLCLFKTRTGQYTAEEFQVAYRSFKETGKPLIYTFFMKAEVGNDPKNRAPLTSLWDFQDELSKLGHFYTKYNSIHDLQLQFSRQLDKLIDNNNF
jgi:hypothetical protein